MHVPLQATRKSAAFLVGTLEEYSLLMKTLEYRHVEMFVSSDVFEKANSTRRICV